jgi:hypothetical protein
MCGPLRTTVPDDPLEISADEAIDSSYRLQPDDPAIQRRIDSLIESELDEQTRQDLELLHSLVLKHADPQTRESWVRIRLFVESCL